MPEQPLEQTYTLAGLDPAVDYARLCAELNLPLPTPDVTLEHVMDMRAMTVADAYAALARTTDPRLMDVARRMRTVRVIRLPPDPRLAPKPHAPLAHAPPRPAREASAPRPVVPLRAAPAVRETAPWDRPGVVLTQLAPNPKKPGSASHENYKRYVLGASISELRARGVTTADLRWDLDHKFIEFGRPAAATAGEEP